MHLNILKSGLHCPAVHCTVPPYNNPANHTAAQYKQDQCTEDDKYCSPLKQILNWVFGIHGILMHQNIKALPPTLPFTSQAQTEARRSYLSAHGEPLFNNVVKSMLKRCWLYVSGGLKNENGAKTTSVVGAGVLYKRGMKRPGGTACSTVYSALQWRYFWGQQKMQKICFMIVHLTFQLLHF